jgi:hypothetical protein
MSATEALGAALATDHRSPPFWGPTRAMQHFTFRARTFVAALALPVLASEAAAQNRYLFSIDWQGPTVGLPTTTGAPITEGDILRPTTLSSLPALGAPTPPSIAIPHGAGGLGLLPVCAGHMGGTPCIVEVDALSLGVDHHFMPNVPIRAGQILFSVDEYAGGLFPSPTPSVGTEGPVGDAAADGFVNLGTLVPAPLAPAPGRNVGVQDGDGLASGSGVTYPSVGLREPIIAAPGPFNAGDSIDALDYVETSATSVIGRYFSLDSGFPDPLDLVPNTGSAAAHGFVGGDVLTNVPGGGGAPVVYAPAMMLGLDLVGGPNSDDLDALILRENNTAGYQRSFQPFDWMSPNTDMLIFSVRRGSAVIGMPDSLFGLPIMPGDLLIPPIPTALGGISPFPAIFIAAENLGLRTLRFSATADDLCAADSLRGTIHDCDGDGVEDAIAIALGSVVDANFDGVPDSCQLGSVGTPFCLCAPGSPAPCGNFFAGGGCLNFSGTGAVLSGFGTASVAADNLFLTTSGMNPATFAVPIISATSFGPALIQNGKLCVGPTFQRMGAYPTGTGTMVFGPIVGLASTLAPPIVILPLSTWNFQVWYRDIGGPCGGNSNLSNALAVTFTP